MKATIAKDSPRYQHWLEVFGTDTVEVLYPIPYENEGPDGRRLFYQVNTRTLTLKQRARLVNHVCKHWGLSHEEVVSAMDDPAHGVPIAADDVIVPMSLFP